MAPDDKGKFPGLSSRQENLKERTRRLKEKLEMLAQLFPGMDTEILNDLKEAAGSMGEASGRLKRRGCPWRHSAGAGGDQRLSKSQQAMQQMAQQMAMQMQAARWGYPLVTTQGRDGITVPGFPCPPFPSRSFSGPGRGAIRASTEKSLSRLRKMPIRFRRSFREKVDGVPERRGSFPVQEGCGKIFQRVDRMRLRIAVLYHHLPFIFSSSLLFSPLEIAAVSPEVLKSLSDKAGTLGCGGGLVEVKGLLVQEPKDPKLLELASHIAFYRGDYQEALKLMKSALELEEEEKRKGFVLFLEETIGVTQSLKRYESPHF